MTVYFYFYILVIFNVFMNCFLLRTNLKSSFRTSVRMKVDSYFANNRFWTEKVLLNLNSTESMNIVSSKLTESVANNSIDMSRINFGIAICHSVNKIIPIHDGKLQFQHATKYMEPLMENYITICAFSPRASHVVTSPDDGERQIEPARLKALNDALERIGSVSPVEIMSDEYAGTPPARIYRSFVAPRPKAVHIVEPVERAANRTALQLELALRQVRADRAEYLRNTDRSLLEALDAADSSAASSDIPDGSESESAGTAFQANKLARPSLHPVVLLLDNVRSAFNVGSMFRTAETAGAAGIITCGITAHPPHEKLRKTAFSALDVVPTRHFEDTMAAVSFLRAEGYTICVMETTARSRVYTQVEFPKKLALVLGNEVTGVDTRVMEAADLIVQIPTFGVKNSLNVASAAPIVLFEVLRQWTDNHSTFLPPPSVVVTSSHSTVID